MERPRSHHPKGVTTTLSEVQSPSAFQLSYPDLLAGQEQMRKSEAYAVEWDTTNMPDTPTMVVMEYRV